MARGVALLESELRYWVWKTFSKMKRQNAMFADQKKVLMNITTLHFAKSAIDGVKKNVAIRLATFVQKGRKSRRWPKRPS